MALEHSALTGDQLHEPKGVATAASGEVYVADGAGSGSWTDRHDGHLNRNLYELSQRFDDLATATDIYFNVPYKSELNKLNVILYGAVDADTVITIYIGGVLFADSLSITAAGTAAGQKKTLVVTTGHSIPAGTIVSVRSNGAATASVKAEVQLELEMTV